MTKIVRDMIELIREQKAYFLAPLLLMVLCLVVLFYHFGRSFLVTFVYAGL